MQESTINKRAKKAERREAKEIKKAKNQKTEKTTRPNNLLLAVLIFGAIALMLIVGKGIEYFHKDATIAQYIKNNGGKEAFSGMQMDDYTTADITAKKNKMNIVLTIEADDKEQIEKEIQSYKDEEGEETLKDIESYFLCSISPQTRALFSDVTISVKHGDDEIAKDTMTYWEAKRYIEEQSKKASETESKRNSNEAE